MAEIQEKDTGEGKGKQKKKSFHLDFTPMVDMNMLLITFFMLCTSLSKPQALDIALPSKDKVEEGKESKVEDTRAITIILDGENKIFYYMGKVNYEDYTSVQETDFSPEGLRALLLNRNKKVVEAMKELKQKKLESKINDADFDTQLKEIKEDKSAPVIMIKATDAASYMNLIDALDEMQICNISTYAILDMSEGDNFVLENYKQKGALTLESAANAEIES